MARSVFESLRIFWQNTISSVKKLRLWQSIADRAWLFEIIFGVLTLFISLAAYMVSQQANFLSGESNKIAITAIAQSEESNKIAITAIAQSDESNKIAATQVARSDESNKIAATAIAVSKKSVQDADSRSAESNQIARESLENSKTKLTIGVENATEFQLNQGAITFVCLHRIVINNGGGKAGEIEDYEFVLIFDNTLIANLF